MWKKIIIDNIETNYSVSNDGRVINDTTKKEVNKKPEDIIKDPYVLEFLGL